MKTIIRLLTITLLLTSFPFIMNAQEEEGKLTKKEANNLLAKAEENFENKNYLDALDEFTQ